MSLGRIGSVAVWLGPPILAGTFVLYGFVENAVPIGLLARPMLIAVIAALAIEVVAIVLLGRLRGAFWASVVVAALCGMFVLAGAMVLALTVLGVVVRRPGREYVLAVTVATSVAAVLLAFMVVAGWRQGAFAWDPLDIEPMDLGSAAHVGPNIHVLLLDGYPRHDELLSQGIDDEAFLSALADRGFDVYPDSHSNYDRTPFSVMTMLSGRHLEEIPALGLDDPPEALAPGERIAARALLSVPIFDALERLGYTTRALAGPVVHVPIGGADEIGSAGTANNFEIVLLQRTPLAWPLTWIGFPVGQQQDHIRWALDRYADPPDGPSFTFTHVVAPHPPLVLTDGDSAGPPPCYPAQCDFFENDPARLGWTDDEFRERFGGQIAELGRLVITATDELLARDPDAVILIVSDHGMHVADDPEAIFRNLIVARTPGHPGLLGTAPGLINAIPDVLRAYLGADLPTLADRIHFGGTAPWLSVDPLDGNAAP